MAFSFSDMVSNDVDIFFDTLDSKVATYTPITGDAVTTKAILDTNRTARQQYDDSEGQIAEMSFIVPASDVTTPAIGAKLTVDSTVYEIVDREDQQGIWRLTCIRFIATERTADRYRTERR